MDRLDDLATLLALARLEATVGRTPEANIAVERSLVIDPDPAPARQLHSDVAERQGDLESAIRLLGRACDLGRAGGDDPDLDARFLDLDSPWADGRDASQVAFP